MEHVFDGELMRTSEAKEVQQERFQYSLTESPYKETLQQPLAFTVQPALQSSIMEFRPPEV